MARKLDDWIEGYMALTDNTEPPHMYREWIAISVIASALQRKCFLGWGDITFYPNMYIVLVGPSGKCRKGTAMGTGAWFLRKLGVSMAAEAITREALIRELANCSVDDIVEGEMIKHSSLTIFSPELTVFLGYNNLQLISDITDWYDCREIWTYRTKGSGTDEIVGVWVNLIGATTPSLIRDALPRDAIGGGLASRVIFVYEDQKGKVVPFPFVDAKMDDLKQALVHDLADIALMSGRFTVQEDFLDLWADWYIEQEQKPRFNDPNFDGYVQRRPNHVMKLCMIISASSRDDMIIDRVILERAIDLLNRTEVKMPQVFSGYGASPHSEVMNRIMEFILQERTTNETEIIRTFYSDITDRRQLHLMFGIMQQMKFVTLKATPTNGYEVTLNPNFKRP